MKKVFKDFLNKYYKESLVKKKDKGQKDFGSKVNDCVVSTYNKYSDKQITSKDVILPSGCYSMMLETEDKNVFTKCLSVLPNINDMNPNMPMRPCPKISPNVCGNYTEPLYQYDVCG